MTLRPERDARSTTTMTLREATAGGNTCGINGRDTGIATTGYGRDGGTGRGRDNSNGCGNSNSNSSNNNSNLRGEGRRRKDCVR